MKKYSMLTILPALLIAQGCQAPLTGPAWSEPAWGEQIEGLQCRLRAEKRTWNLTETPTFKFDIRNQGKRTFTFWPAHKLELCQIEFDGKWHRWPKPIMIDSQLWPLSPAAQYNGVTIELDKRFKIELTPGRHTVRIAFSLEGIQVVSNPVGIKILRAGSETNRDRPAD